MKLDIEGNVSKRKVGGKNEMKNKRGNKEPKKKVKKNTLLVYLYKVINVFIVL